MQSTMSPSVIKELPRPVRRQARPASAGADLGGVGSTVSDGINLALRLAWTGAERFFALITPFLALSACIPGVSGTAVPSPSTSPTSTSVVLTQNGDYHFGGIHFNLKGNTFKGGDGVAVVFGNPDIQVSSAKKVASSVPKKTSKEGHPKKIAG